MGLHHDRAALHFRGFVDTTFQDLKMEIEEQFGPEIHAVLPLFQRHTQLTMARYFNDATIMGTQAPLPQVKDLIDIIKYRRWSQLPPLPLRYTWPCDWPGRLGQGNQLSTHRTVHSSRPCLPLPMTLKHLNVFKTSPTTMS
jgi:hypothetical protein